MSNEEQKEAILRVVMQRTEARKRLALLENELRTAGKSLSDIGDGLKHMSAAAYEYKPSYLIPKIDAAPAICGLERIRAMLVEIEETAKTLAELRKTAEEIGID